MSYTYAQWEPVGAAAVALDELRPRSIAQGTSSRSACTGHRLRLVGQAVPRPLRRSPAGRDPFELFRNVYVPSLNGLFTEDSGVSLIGCLGWPVRARVKVVDRLTKVQPPGVVRSTVGHPQTEGVEINVHALDMVDTPPSRKIMVPVEVVQQLVVWTTVRSLAHDPA